MQLRSTSRPLVSVVVPVGGWTAHLEEAIASVLKQTFQDFEIVVALDGPQETARKIISRFDSRIVLCESKRKQGASRTRNLGIHIAKGRLIATLDADDSWPPDHLESLVPLFDSRSGLVLVGTSANVVNTQGNLLRKIKVAESDLHRRLIWGNRFVHSSTIFRKSAALKAGLYNPMVTIEHDYEFWLRLATLGQIANVCDRYVNYRVHNAQMSSKSTDLDSLKCLMVARKQLARRADIKIFSVALFHLIWSAGRYASPMLKWHRIARPKDGQPPSQSGETYENTEPKSGLGTTQNIPLIKLADEETRRENSDGF